MKFMVNIKIAGIGLLLLLSATLTLHILIIAGIVPFQIFWGGQMENDAANMLMMEIVAVAVLALFIGITILNTYYPFKYRKLAKVGIWIVFAYLLLNTAGNLVSEAFIEKAVMAPVTFLMSLLSLRLAISKKT